MKWWADVRRGRQFRRCAVLALGLAAVATCARWPTSATGAEIDKPAATRPASATQPLTSTRPTRPPRQNAAKPDAAALAAGEARVRRVFREAFALPAATQPADRERKAAYARRFLRQGAMAEADAGERFALLSAARVFAADAGDTVGAMRAVARLAQAGATPTQIREMALNALESAAAVAEGPVPIEDNARAFVQLIDAALATGDHALVERASLAARTAASRSNDAVLIALLTEVATTHPDASKAIAGASAIEKVRTAPADASSHFIVGTHLCFDRGNWTDGLPYLSRGTDSALKKLADRDADGSADPAAMAEAWWTGSEERAGRPKEAMRRRAAHWYAIALPGLMGPSREAAAKRLEEVRVASLRPGLIADLYSGETFDDRRGMRIDQNIAFQWNERGADARVDADHFSICWQGHIRAPRAGKYELVVTADDGFAVRIDGRLVTERWWYAPGPTRAVVQMTGEPQAFALLYKEVFMGASIRLQWRAPAEAGEPAGEAVDVPPSALWHDPVWPWGPTAQSFGARPADAVVCAPADAGGETVWFQRYGDDLPWHAAQRRCEQMGGHLAWALRPDQNDALERLAGGWTVWLGGNDEDLEDWWAWTNGQRIDNLISNWGEGQPDGQRRENGLSILERRGWNDGAGAMGFICQWDR